LVDPNPAERRTHSKARRFGLNHGSNEFFEKYAKPEPVSGIYSKLGVREEESFMFCSRNRRNPRQNTSEYATRADFQKIFSDDMAGLHLLAYLLAGDRQMAEQVFLSGLEDSIHGNPVFRQWARSWSRRAIIKRAIRALAPSPNDPQGPHAVAPDVTGNSEVDELVAAVATLNTFQRFVFVLSILEAYSTTECAALLACTGRDVVSAKAEALKVIAASGQVEPSVPQVPVASWKSLFTSTQAS